MDNQYKGKIESVTFHQFKDHNVLFINVEDMGVELCSHSWNHKMGNFSGITLKNLTLGEIIGLRDKLTLVIDEEVAKLNKVA